MNPQSWFAALVADTPAQFWWVMGGVLALLIVASAIGFVLGRMRPGAVVDNLVARINAWWVMVAVLCACFLLGRIATLVLFALASFLALREFITLTPTRPGDHLPLCLCFYVAIPLQYWLIGSDWYGLFVILIPVYGFLLLPAVSALAGDTEHFLERNTKIQWGLMLTVYCISHAPALLLLRIPGFEGSNLLLLLYLLLVVQISDVLQYVFGKLFGRHKLAPKVSPSKTIEGLVGGGLSAAAIGAALWWITPFTPLQSGMLSLLIVLCGFLGGLALSAVKRSLGAKDWGQMIEGHGGMLDRLDSVTFAAPVFFHVVRYGFA
ncbi:phosphatidate cytidylyltransferase [Dokdonella sp.]|uniref:phosphatidate cytidylyltransferase n=1 Tax=Dokdonella sp. TaxID=2291710 RepID=UPI0025BECCED|nr:phosphatidate cytidylyltransferase [Dokdonella sp.]MBX3692417.1 phosphatidate cytidylyltransferase [Dokdonella sp.]MCW5566673.1 phosphatidate cytidylyltransferase [Dokdonella sp.]